MLVRLFGSSEFLSQILIRHPEMLDNLVRADLVRLEVPKAALAAELDERDRSATESYEGRLDALRRFRHEQFLRIGINDLDNLLPFHVASSQLSDLADVCLEAAWRVAEEETRRRYGIESRPGRFAVVGLGKLGARELTYNSDLDLIFVYVPSAPSAGSVSVHEFFTKLAQTMMTTLQVQTREGRMYSIDTRLRPSGNQGPLVSSLESFARYHAESAQLWERQAMIKARGGRRRAALCSEVEAIVERFVYARPLRDDEVAEIHRLRMRLERELAGDERAEFNVKTGRGGLLDIEFMVQMKQLRHGTDVPAVRRRATRHALAALAEAGVVPPAEAASPRGELRVPARAHQSAPHRARPAGRVARARGRSAAGAGASPRLRGIERRRSRASSSPTTDAIANASGRSLRALVRRLGGLTSRATPYAREARPKQSLSPIFAKRAHPSRGLSVFAPRTRRVAATRCPHACRLATTAPQIERGGSPP